MYPSPNFKLRQVVVVFGFGEVGPWDNSRTRWEMEAYGQFSREGCIELVWRMGLDQVSRRWLDCFNLREGGS
jgi:3-oxoacyl-ACP reductase-like protein